MATKGTIVSTQLIGGVAAGAINSATTVQGGAWGAKSNTVDVTVDDAIPTYVGKGTRSVVTAPTAPTPALPASLQDNDILILAVETDEGTISSITGWTQVDVSPETNPSLITTLHLWWKRYTSGDTAPSISNPNGDHANAQIFAFRGVKTSGTPYSASEASGFSATTAFTIPMTTTALNNQLIALFVGDAADVTTNRFAGLGSNASLANLSQRESQSADNSNGGGLSVWTGEKATAGDCGDLTGTLATGTGFACIAIALTPS